MAIQPDGSIAAIARRAAAVVGISGGIDSSVVAALCARAFGPDKVIGISMPEKESSSVSSPLAEELALTLAESRALVARLDGRSRPSA